jgi:hypothetical protein
MTITLEEEVASWARRKAGLENTSVAKLAGQMLKDEMARVDDYWRAYEHWKSISGFAAKDDVEYLS